MAARTVQRHDQFRAVKHCMLKILVERDGIVRAGIHTELAEHARTEVVFVLNQYLLFLPSSVSTISPVTLIVSLGQAIWHKPQATHRCSFYHYGAWSACHGNGRRVSMSSGFRILFGSLSSAEYGHGCLHTRQQRSDAVYESADIRVLFFHYFCLY